MRSQRLKAQRQPRGYVAAFEMRVGGDIVVGHCRAGVDHQAVASGNKRQCAHRGGYAVMSQSGGCGIVNGKRHGQTLIEHIRAHAFRRQQFFNLAVVAHHRRINRRRHCMSCHHKVEVARRKPLKAVRLQQRRS